MVVTSYSSWKELNDNPCWPPPFLWKVVVEYRPYGGGNFFTCDLTRRVDSAMIYNVANQLDGTGIKEKLLTLFASRNPESVIAAFSDQEHSILKDYLDSIGRLEPIQALDVSPYFNRLKAMIYRRPSPSAGRGPTPIQADLTAIRVNNVLSTLTFPGWPLRLNTGTKSVTMHLADFLFRQLHPERTINPSNLTSLTIYINDKDGSSHTPARGQAHDNSSNNSAVHNNPHWQELLARPIPQPPVPPASRMLETRLLELARHAGPSLRALHLLLKMDAADARRVHQPQGRLLNRSRLRRGTVQDGDGPAQAAAAIAAATAQAVQADKDAEMRRLVDGLPPGVQRLNLVEWFGVDLDAGDPGIQHKWWARQQRLAVVALKALGRFFQLVRPTLKRVDLVRGEPPFELFPHEKRRYMKDDEEMGEVVLEYEARGIELRLGD
ncbi:hypothetical protein C8A01DRAFT_39752 [Parachaetomium inaequale]|uniref:Uncharacterized protein n=1 Tax=Parachaetomium inaequale TaxID=2588326 RepID=A0AAN6PD28_9PEZI|nr:hypothetical protein C8A01DRAFT_39752 [Parachaetomium inaequale]